MVFRTHTGLVSPFQARFSFSIMVFGAIVLPSQGRGPAGGFKQGQHASFGGGISQSPWQPSRPVEERMEVSQALPSLHHWSCR